MMRSCAIGFTAAVLLASLLACTRCSPWLRSGLHAALESSHVEVLYSGYLVAELRAEPAVWLTYCNASTALYESRHARALVEVSSSFLKVVVRSDVGWAGVSCRVSGGLLWAPCGLPPVGEVKWPLRYRLELYTPLVVYYWPSRGIGFVLCCPPGLSFRLSASVSQLASWRLE